MKTKTIAGHKITLKTGLHYEASRPLADGRKFFDVTIKEMYGSQEPVILRGLSYDEANVFLNKFNGKMSFAGRLWS